MILGEHGDSMFPVWSGATVGGVPIHSLPGFDDTKASALFQRARGSGAEVIRTKGGAGSAVGVSIRAVVHAILLDTGSILPVSSLQKGAYGLTDVSLSVPTKVGRKGVVEQMEVALNESERAALVNSGEVLKKTLAQVG